MSARSSEEEELRRAILEQDVHALDPPSLVHKTLLLLGIKTIGDLVALDMEEAASYKGVGTTKIDALTQLRRDAMRLQKLEVDEDTLSALTAPGLLEELTAAQIDLDQPWSQILRLLDLRTRNVLEHHDIVTLRELVLRLEAGTLLSLQGFGQGSLEHVKQHLTDLIYMGEEGYLWGELGKAPTHLDESVSHVLQSLDSDDHLLIMARFIQQKTLEEVGSQMGISRERVRQRIERVLHQVRRQWQDHFSTLLSELCGVLQDRGGLISSSLCRALTDNANEDHVLFALEIVEISARWCAVSHFLTTLQINQIESLFQQLREDICHRATRGLVSIEQLEQMASTRGWPAPAPEIVAFLENRWDVSLRHHQGTIEHPWMDWGLLCSEILSESPEPRSLEELSAALATRFGLEQPPSSRQLYLAISPREEILAAERGLYMHRASLELSDEELAEFEEDAIALTRTFPHAVSTAKLLQVLEENYPRHTQKISPMLLRDILGRHPRIKLFQSTDMVAHLDSFEGRRQTQSELLDELLVQQLEPLDCEAICKLIPDHISFHPQAIYSTLLQAPFVLNLGQGLFLHQESVGLTERAMGMVCQQAVALLQEWGAPRSASRLLAALPDSPNTAYLKAHPHGARILMATLMAREETCRAGAGDLMVWEDGAQADRDEETSLKPLELLLSVVMQEHDGPLRTSELLTSVRERAGWDGSTRTFYHALIRCVESGRLSKEETSSQEAQFSWHGEF